jgi:hypothetical protein
VDGDEVPDVRDNCPDVKNGSQINTDGDTEGDACDADDDGDGVPDSSDNCRVDANPDQTPGPDPRYGAACPPVDNDGDGVLEEDDNCERPGTPLVANADQADIDGDDKGDACDSDVDGDDFDNAYDNCPTVYNEAVDLNGDGFRAEQSDRDRDGVGTECDPDELSVGGPGPGQGKKKDRTRPRLRVGVARLQRLAAVRAGLVVKLRCSEACGATVELQVRRAVARRLGLRRTRVLATGSVRLQGAGTTYAFVRFDPRVRGKLFGMRRVSSKLTAIAVDGGGNRRSLSRSLRLVG